MGFFTRRKRPSTPASQPPAATLTVNHIPTTSPPPPYDEQLPPQTSPPPAQDAVQQYACLNDQFMSIDDFNAIQHAINQDAVMDQFSEIITNIDEDQWNDNDDDYSITVVEEESVPSTESRFATTRALVQAPRPPQPRAQKITIWSKVSFYSNSRLPSNLPPLRVYIPTWPLICLAAQYSANAYKSPQSVQERNAFVSADARLGTKAMVMKSVPCDDKKTLVFAIRGTSTLSLRDWNVNLHTAPTSPVGFLDDEGNLCHAGFLRVAKAMIHPIALRLRTLLEENPSRASCSLLITGHSAGGAVAALLFAHMLSSVRSELSILTECFKRVHCVTFGAPPVTLLPLQKPEVKKYRKSLFFSFANEGDPVVRAEKAYIRSLIDLLSSPLPALQKERTTPAKNSPSRLQNSISRLDLTQSRFDLTDNSIAPRNPLRHNRMNLSLPNISLLPTTEPARPPPFRHWPVPTSTLSNAGRLVVMRVPAQPQPGPRRSAGMQRTTSNRWEKDHLSRVTAHTVTDDQLRKVIFGDPSVHAMEVYLRRVDMLALKAVTARE